MSAEGVAVRPMRASDWSDVAVIYRAGIDTGDATFETDVPEYEVWDSGHLSDLRLVAVDDADRPIGFIAASQVSNRQVYRGVIEHSVYVHPDHQARGVGRALLEAFIRASEKAGYWTIQTGIFPENETSLALHRACGFRDLGIRHHVGRHHGRWRDVVVLERRSPTVGGPTDSRGAS